MQAPRDEDLQEREVFVPTGYVVATAECHPADITRVGGKAIGLGRLIRAGQRVPSSFVVSADAYLEYVGALSPDLDGSMPAAIAEEIVSAYRGLCEAQGTSELTVAVRSSATIEDSTEASCAGQFRTFLGATGADEVLREVERCFLSAFEPHVDSYRAHRSIASDDEGVAVVVQELVSARASGVMFTRHPRTGDRSLVVVESSYGLGEAVVGGEVTPDLFEVNKITGHVHERMLGSKATEHDLTPDGRSVETRPVDEDRRSAWSISDEEIEALVQVGRDLEQQIGRGLDIEWAIGRTVGTGAAEELFVLQVRPITVDPKHANAGVVVAQNGRVHNPIDVVLGRLAGRDQTGASR